MRNRPHLRGDQTVAELRLCDDVVVDALERLDQARVQRHAVREHGSGDVVELAEEDAPQRHDCVEFALPHQRLSFTELAA